MSKITVSLIDMAGNQSALPLPNDKVLEQLIPSIVTLLDLTETDEKGRELQYRLFSRRLHTVLSDSGTLYSNGILEKDHLRIVPIPFSKKLELELLGEPSPGACLPLPNATQVTIGRGSENDLVIRHAAVSRSHGQFTWQDGMHIYRDLNSANGSYINNQVVAEPIPISPGSILSLGESVRLVYKEAPLEEDHQDTQEYVNTLRLMDSEVFDSQMRTGLSPLPRGSVFISYNHNELPLVTALVNRIREANFHIFWDQEIPPGGNIIEAISTGLNLADVMLAVLTPDAILSPYLLDQWNSFVLSRKPIIGLVYIPCEIPSLFDDYEIIEYHDNINQLSNEVIAMLMESLR